MTGSNKNLLNIIGVIFLIAGIGSALEMFNIPFSCMLLLLIGLSFLCCYFKFRLSVFKYLASFFIPVGISYFAIVAFNVKDEINFLLLYMSFACAFLCVYFFTKRSLFMYISLAVILFALHVFTNAQDAIGDEILGYDCFYISLLAIFLFIFENRKLKFYPLIVSLIFYLIGTLSFLYAFGNISANVYKLIISTVFLLIGITIITVNYLKTKEIKKESCNE